MDKTTLKVNLINPGAVRTGMRAQAYPGEDPMTLPTPDDITDAFVRLAEPSCDFTGRVVDVRRPDSA
jgi:NAD(P)-dependent dehydrogenase (short-subunit alcohol dehydrogenase family)